MSLAWTNFTEMTQSKHFFIFYFGSQLGYNLVLYLKFFPKNNRVKSTSPWDIGTLFQRIASLNLQ